MCRLAVDDGVTTIVASPHMFNGMYEVTRRDILEGVKQLRERLVEEAIPLFVVPGADVHSVPDLERHVREGRTMTVGDLGKHIMIELPQDVLPRRLEDFLFSIQLEGVVPVISHPERNLEVQAKPQIMKRYVEAGALLQLTAASVTGAFGSLTQGCAHALLAARMGHLVASDGHSPRRRPPGLSKAFAVTKELVGVEEAEGIFLRRPQKILDGDYVELPDPISPASKKKRFPWWGRGKKQDD